MDTRGLSALGLPDLQTHFRNLDPGRVAGHLYRVARYLFDQGDCIADGETIGGFTDDDKWRCRHEMSLVAPERARYRTSIRQRRTRRASAGSESLRGPRFVCPF
jgi:hypothetical protein